MAKRASEISTFEHSRVGCVVLNRSPRATRISIGVKRDGTVKLTVPLDLPQSHGVQFLESKLDWIVAAQRRTAERPSNQIEIIEPPFSTKFHALRLLPDQNNQLRTEISQSEIRVYYPFDRNYKDPDIQHYIQSAVEETCRIEAKAYLAQRTMELAAECRKRVPQYGWSVGLVSVRKARTRWGSCSGINNISLNIALMLLPDRLIDYVILHELTHIVHKDHSPQFHALLNHLTGGKERELISEIRSYSTTIVK